MPGIYGYIKRTLGESNQLISMTGVMKRYDYFVQDNQFGDDSVAASRVHLGHIGEKSSPYQNGPVHLWIEGEAYNLTEVADKLQLTQKGFAATLVEAYQRGKLDNYLNLLDGYFCAALYDSSKKTLKLVSDRYGMRMLYWYCKDGLFAWASEVKGILALDSINKTIDATSPQCFLDLGYLMGEHTWFEHIKLIKPATVLEFNITSQIIEQHYYWKWSEIQPYNFTFAQAVDELGACFIAAVKRRFAPNEKVGISLSGGLDSRAILAAVNHLYPDYQGYCYTFGHPGCDDIKIAQLVVSRTTWKHQLFYLNERNWLAPRLDKIWNTDGMLDMMHMHGSEFLDAISHNMYVNLNGYCGDAILGGSFLDRVPRNTRVSADNTKSFYNNYSMLSMPDADFYDIEHVEPNLYMNRVRRFTNMGSVNALVKIVQRKPFFDNFIVELAFSLPDEYRLGNKLYSAMLLKFFPRYFNDIPWQKNGCPISYSSTHVKAIKIKNRAMGKLKREVERIGLKYKDLRNFTDYAAWLRQEPARSFFESILFAQHAIYPAYIDPTKIQSHLKDHLQNKANYASELCRAVTFEIWLQQVFEGRHQDILF